MDNSIFKKYHIIEKCQANTKRYFTRWDEIFEDCVLAVALVVQVTFTSHIMNMNAESHRLKQRKKVRAD